MMNKFTKLQIILIGFLILTYNLSEAYIPQVGTVTLFEDDNGQTTTSTSQMTPNDEMTLLVQVFDEFDVIYGVNFYIWDGTTNSEKGTDTSIDHATYQWSKNDGWKLVGPLSSTWTIDKDNCKIATSTTGTGTLKLVFTPGKIARYQQNSDWKIKVVVCYTNQSQDVSGEINISNAYYSEVNIDSQDAFFTSSFADTNDNPLTSPINLNIISNSKYILQIKAEDFIGENGGTISLPGPLGYALTNTSSLQNTVTPTYQTMGTYPATSEQGATQTLYLWLDYPVGQSPGTYNSQSYLATSDTKQPYLYTAVF